MKFNNTYEQKINLKETIKEINSIENQIIELFKEEFSLFKVTPPLIFKEDSIDHLPMEHKTRDVSFELGHSGAIATLAINQVNWVRSLFKKIKVNEKEIVFFPYSSIFRDIDENTHATVIKNELFFYINSSNEEVDDNLKEIVEKIYRRIHDISKLSNKKYNLKSTMPEKPIYITSQQMANEFPDLSFKEREDEMILDINAFILKNSGFKLFSGKRHNLLPSQVYDLKRTYEFLFKDYINSDSINIGSVSVLASGDQLKDQLITNNLAALSERDFYKDLIEDRKKIIEVKINIPKLVQSILQKGHISEVQSGVISEEANNLRSKNDLEIY